ncbi:MAG: hypothetical protein ACRCYX_03130 [Dermatophilaceae bacterium]
MIDTELPGSFASLSGVATWLEDLAGAMESAGDDAARARSGAGSDWEGASHDAYDDHAGQVISAGNRRAAVVRRCADAVQTFAWELRSCQAQMVSHRERAVAGGLEVSGLWIRQPPHPLLPGPPLLMATPAQLRAEQQCRDEFADAVARLELYEDLAREVRATFNRVDASVESTLAPAQQEAASESGLDVLLRHAKGVAERTGNAADFIDGAFTVRERDLRKAAKLAAVSLAASRSGNPAVRHGTKAPTPEGLANASKPGTAAARVMATADDVARWGRYLKYGGPIIGLVGSGIALSQGEPPSQVVVAYLAGIAGGAIAGAAIAGTILGGSVVLAGVAVVLASGLTAAGATAAWNAWVPDDVRESIDRGLVDAWDWTKETASDAWGDATDAASGAWKNVFG